jgi:alpha-L-arabinofuranosidase
MAQIIKTTGEVIVKVINTAKQAQDITLNLQGMTGAPVATTLTLSYNGSMDDENTLDNPTKITPVAGTVQCQTAKKAVVLNDQLPAMSFRLYRIKK